MQSVADFDENHSNIVAHGEQEFLEILSLCRSLVSKDSTTDFGESVNDLGNLFAEDIADIFYGVVGIFHHIVQQGCTDAGRTESHFLAGYLSHGDRVHDIGFARKTAHSFVRLSGEVEGFGHNIYLFAMSRAEVGVEQMLKGIAYQFVVGLLSF